MRCHNPNGNIKKAISPCLAHTFGPAHQHPIKFSLKGYKRPKRSLRNEWHPKDPLKFSLCPQNRSVSFPPHTTHINVRQANYHNTLPLLVLPNSLYKMVILLGGTQSKWTNLNSLCHSPKVKRQCKKKWSTVSSFSIHNKQTSGLRVL